jgi:hypothetical protein
MLPGRQRRRPSGGERKSKNERKLLPLRKQPQETKRAVRRARVGALHPRRRRMTPHLLQLQVCRAFRSFVYEHFLIFYDYFVKWCLV